MSAHTCHADGCDVVVPRKMFMCRQHWFMLPESMRDAVWAAYTPGQENNLGRVTAEYLDVTMRCIEYVAEQEARA